MIESAGLVSSLTRFARLYANAWREELAQHTGWGRAPAPGAGRDGEGDSAGGRGDARAAGPDAGAGKPQRAPRPDDGQKQHAGEAESQFRLTAKRVATLVSLGITVPSLMVWNHVGFWLDGVLYGDWKEQEVYRPVFIVGNARSGTTWAHRVLAEDETHFTAPELWEMIFAQSVTWRILFFRLSILDRRMGGPVGRLLRKIDQATLGNGRVHRFGLWRKEEDEWMMMNIAACQLAAFMFPLIDDNDLRNLIYFDSRLSDHERRVVFDYYRTCIQRHLYAHDLMEELRFHERIRIRDRARGGKRPTSQRAMSLALLSPTADEADASSRLALRASGGSQDSNSGKMISTDLRKKTASSGSGGRDWFRRRRVRYLSKNPTFTLRLRSIFESFPDANVVVMVRDPFRAIPSMVSYMALGWKLFASPTVKYPFRDALTHMCSLHYTYPVRICNSHVRCARQMCFLHYELCVDDLVKSFTALYAHLGLSMTGRMAASLMEEAKLSRQYASMHRYNLVETTGQTLPDFMARHRAAFQLYPAYARGLDIGYSSSQRASPDSPGSAFSSGSNLSSRDDADASSASGSSSSYALVMDDDGDEDGDGDGAGIEATDKRQSLVSDKIDESA
ncbi:Hypothetical Protein FCC1311_083602 [Hondaea fermentalgiana]|uniref:Uncharacterized protein n=1 Tax=Hondaea fermentalgiana TaxID=2315210 RepID=A0A2R5GND7_9STRA|nr:Hypothetical Protein FCC1311_083602 [Hondaea fermentalgiana]|eukprot:GBG32135.1 Hypothetical Protein FCC1311_083602 [Hondaea fermentalgiana]